MTTKDPLTFVYKLVWVKDLHRIGKISMNSSIVVLCTCKDGNEAQRIAEALVESRLAACVNMLRGIQSIYRWQGAVETAHEVLLLIKSTTERFDEVRARITELHS